MTLLTTFYILIILCIALSLLGIFKRTSNTSEGVAAVILSFMVVLLLFAGWRT